MAGGPLARGESLRYHEILRGRGSLTSPAGLRRLLFRGNGGRSLHLGIPKPQSLRSKGKPPHVKTRDLRHPKKNKKNPIFKIDFGR